MACVWCEGDLELHESLFNILKNYLNSTQDNLRRAVQDFYHCSDCINTYHRIKPNFIQTQEDSKALHDVDLLLVTDQLAKAKELIKNNDDDLDYQLPIIEILQYPYFLVNETIADSLFELIADIYDKSEGVEKLPLDSDIDYPGLFLLLLNDNKKVHSWALQSLKDIDAIKSDRIHRYFGIVNSIMNLTQYQNGSQWVQNDQSLHQGIFPDRIPEFLFSKDCRIQLISYTHILKLLPNRLVKKALSNTSNKDFLSKLLTYMQESQELFACGINLLSLLLEKLDSSFWLISNIVNVPTELFTMVKSNLWYKSSLKSSRKKTFRESFVTEADDVITQITGTEGIGTVFNDVIKQSTQAFLFKWFIPLIKTLSEFEKYFAAMITAVTDFLLQLVDSAEKASDLYIQSLCCLMNTFQYLSDIKRLDLLHEKSNKIILQIIAAVTPRVPYSEIFRKLNKTTRVLIDQHVMDLVVQKKKGTDHLIFDTHWKKVIAGDPSFDKEEIEKYLGFLFMKKMVIKSEEQIDNKSNVQKQIKKVQKGSSSMNVITIDSDDDEDTASMGSEVIVLSDSDEEIIVEEYHDNPQVEDNAVDENVIDDEQKDVKGLFPLSFNGSQSPIQISDDEDEMSYNEKTHGEYHFSIDTTNVEEDTPKPQPELEESTDAQQPSTSKSPEKKDETKKRTFNLSGLKQRMGGKIDQQMLIKNKEISKRKAYELITKPSTSEQSDSMEQAPSEPEIDNSVYENQLFDITSNFQRQPSKEIVKSPPPKRTKTAMRPQSLKESRRERLEKELSSPAVLKASSSKKPAAKSTSSIIKPTPKLPETTSKHKYTLDLFHNSILIWDPVNLEQGRDELEISTSLQSVPVAGGYNSFDEYMKINWPLMLLETWAQLRKEWDEISANRNSRKAWRVESVEEQPNPKASLITCSWFDVVSKESSQSHTCGIHESDLVILYFNDGQCKYFGIVDSVQRRYHSKRRRKAYQLSVLTCKDEKIKHFKRVEVLRVTTLTTYIRQWNALIRFQNSLLCKDILKPFRPQTYCHKSDALIQRTDRLMKLNQDQFQAVSSAVKAVHTPYSIPKICLIQGPPGTGKSYTIKTIITHLMQTLALAEKKNSSQDKESKARNAKERSRLLICAPSNAAVDEIVKRLLNSPPTMSKSTQSAAKAPTSPQEKKKNCGDFNLLRVGYYAEPALRRYTLEYLVEQKMKTMKFQHNPDAIQREIKKLNYILDDLDKTCVKLKLSPDPKEKRELYEKKREERTKMQQKQDDLMKQLASATEKFDFYQERKRYTQTLLFHADIICCTLSGAGSEWMVKAFKDFQKRAAFNCVLVDEAGQCTEPDLLIPLQFGASKLILVGDQNQLPATVLSKKASRYNYGQSLFERIIYSLGEYRQTCSDASRGERPAFLLTTQYRMTKEICSYPSKRFYENKLRPAKQLASQKPWPLRPYIVLNIQGQELKTSEGSLHNPLEREYVLALCQAITSRTSIKPGSIGVITPYKQQKHLLQQRFHQDESLKPITVNTIDGYQGQEKEVIILSCVRGRNQNNTIGFLSHPQRMNVALTRAKKTLVILANQSVQIDDDWKDLFANARERNLLFNVDQTESASKTVLREYSPSEVQRANTLSQIQQANNQVRTVQFIENAPMPARPEDPRRSRDQADAVAEKDVTANENIEHLNQTDITVDNQGLVVETDVTNENVENLRQTDITVENQGHVAKTDFEGDKTEDSQQTGVTHNNQDQIAQNVTEKDGVYNAESVHQTDDIENEAGAQNLDSLSTSVHQTDDLNSDVADQNIDEERCEEINCISVVNKDLDVIGDVNVEDQDENGGKRNTQQLCSNSHTTAASVQSIITEENVERVKKILIKPKNINSNNQTISPDRPTSEEDVERVKKILVSPKIMNPCKQTTSPDSPRSDVETFEFMRCPSVIQQSTSLELFTPREPIDRITVIVPNPNSPESTGQESCSDQEKSSCSNEATTGDVEFEICGLSPNIVHLTEDKETNVMCDGLDTSSGVDQTQQSRFGCNYPQTTSISTELESKSPRTVEKNGEESESDYLSPIDGFMSPVYPFPFQNHQQDMDTPGHFHGLVDVLQNKESPPTDIAEISNGKLDFNNVENRIVDVDQRISRTGSMGDLQDKDTGIENSHRQTVPFHTRRDEADFQQPLDCNTPSNGIMSETTTVELEKEQKQETNQHERPSIMNSPQSIQNSDQTNHEETNHQEIPSIIIQNYRSLEEAMAKGKRPDTPTIISNTVSEMMNSIERNSLRVTVDTQIPLMTIPTEQSQDRSQEEDSPMSPRHDFASPDRLPKITFFKESPKTPIDPCKDRLVAFQSPDGLAMTERTEHYILKESPKTHTDQETTNRIFTKLPESKSSPLTTDSDREEQTTSIADFNSGISFDLLQIANNIVDTYQSSLKKKETISNDHINKEAIISNNGDTRKITSNSEKSPKNIFSVVDMISNTSSERKSPQHSTSQSENGTDPIQNKDETALLTTPMVIRIPLTKLPSFKNGTRVIENERINFNNNSIDGTTSTMNPNEQLDLNTNSIEDTTNSPSKEYEFTGNTGSRSPEDDITSTSCATTRITPNLIIDTFPTTETIGEVTTPSYKEVVSVSSNESTPSPFISSPTIAKSFDGSRRNSNNEIFSVSGTEDGSSSQNNVQKPCSRDSNNDSEIVAKVPSDPPISSSLDENNVSTLTQLKQSDSQEGSQDAATIHCIKADSPPVYEKFRIGSYGKFDTKYNEVNNNVPVLSRTLSTDDDLLKEVIEKDEKKSMLMFGHQSKQQNIPVIKSLMDDLFDMCSSQEESSHEMTQDSDSQPESQERIGIHQARNQVEGIGNIIDVDDTRDGSSSNLTSIDLPVLEDLQDSINKTTKNLSEAEPTDTNIEKHPTLKSPEAEEDLQYMMRLISSNLKRMIEESSTGDLKDVQPVNVASVDLEDIEIINLPVENIVDNEEGTAAEPEDEDSTINGNTAKQRSVDAAALVSENSTIDTDNSTRSMVHTENSKTRLKNISTHLDSSVSPTKQPLKDVNNNYEKPEDVQNEDEDEDVDQSQDSATESYATSQTDYDSDKENVENVPITFVSDSDVKKLRVDNKQSNWTKKCYSLRHDFKRVYEDISSDDEFTRLKKEREQKFGYRPVYEEISAEESETDFEADHPPTNRKSISKKSEPKPVYSPIKSGRDTEESDCDLEQKLKLLSDRQPVVKLEKLNVKKKQSNTEVRRGEAKAVPKSKTRLTELKSKVKKNVNSVKSGPKDLKWISCLNKPTSLFMDSSDIPLKIKTVGKVAKESPLMSDFLVSDEAPLKTTKKNRSRPTSPDIKGKKNRSRSNTPTLDVPARTVKKSRSRPTTPTVDTPPLKTNKKSRSRPSSPINDTPPMKISRSNSTDCQPSKQKSREFKIPKKAKSPCKTQTTEKDLQSPLSADQDNTAFLGSHNKKQNSKLPETTPTNSPPVCIDPQTQPDPTSFPLDTILGNMASLSTSLKVKSSRGSEVHPTSSTSNQLSGTTPSHTFPNKVCSQQEPNDQSLNGVSNKTLNTVQEGPMDEDLVPVPITNQRKNEEAPIPSQTSTSTDQTSDLNTLSTTTNSIPSSSLLLKSSGNHKPISGTQGLDPKLELVGQTKDPGIVKTNDLSRPVQPDTLKLSSKKTQGQNKLSTISTNKAQQTNESYRPQSTVSKESKSKQKVSFAEFIAKKKGITAPSTKDLTSVEVKKAPNQVETTRSSTKEPPSTASTSPDTDDITKFVDEELERQIEEQYQLKSPEMNFTPLKNTSQRQIVLSETIQKLRKLRNQGNQQQEPDSVKTTPRAETKTKGSSTSDKGSAMVDKGSTASGKVLAPLQISTDTSKCPKPGVDLLSPTNSISSICSIASNESETKIIETDFGKMKVKKSYLKLPHRHEDGVRCVTFCHRLPQNYKEVDERVLQSQQQQDVRDAPSRAYFKFPHRHSDGTYCETVCSRVLQRETMRSQTQAQPPPPAAKVEKSYNIPWKLIPITFDDSNKNLLDPRLNSRESENPASPDHDDKIDEIVFSPFKSKVIPTQDPRLSPAINTVKKPPVCSFPDQRPTPDTSVVETSVQEESMNICTGSDDSDSELTTSSKKGTVIFDSLDKKKRSEKKRRWDIPASSETNVFNDVLQAIGEFDSKVDSLSTIKKTSPSKENMSQDHAISHTNHGEEASGLTTTGKKDTDNYSTTKNTSGKGTAIDPNRDDNKGIVDQPRRFGFIDKSPSLNERFEKICSSPTDNTILSNKETSTKSPSSVNHTATGRTHKKSVTSTPEGLDTSLATPDGGRTPEQDTHLAERNLDYVRSISKQQLSFHEENTNIELKAALKTPNLPDVTLKDDGIPRYRPLRSDENLLEKQNAVDTKSKKIKMPSLPFVSGRNTPSPTDHMASTLPNTGLQRRLSSSGSSLYSPTNPTCLSSNNNSAEASPNPPSRQPSSFEFPLDRTWITENSPLDNNSAPVKNPLKELSMQKHMQSTMFPFPPAVFPQNNNNPRDWNPLPFLNPTNRYPSLSLSSVSSGSLTSPIIPSPQSRSTSPSLWSVFSKALSPLLTAKQHTTRRTSSSTSTSSSTTGPLSPRENRKLTPLHALQESPTHLEAQVTSNIWQRNASTLLIKTPTIPISQNPEIMSLLDQLMLESLDKLIHEYFNEAPTFQEKSYLLEIARDFILGLLEKGNVTSEDLLLQVVDAGIRDALMSVQSHKQQDGYSNSFDSNNSGSGEYANSSAILTNRFAMTRGISTERQSPVDPRLNRQCSTKSNQDPRSRTVDEFHRKNPLNWIPAHQCDSSFSNDIKGRSSPVDPRIERRRSSVDGFQSNRPTSTNEDERINRNFERTNESPEFPQSEHAHDFETNNNLLRDDTNLLDSGKSFGTRQQFLEEPNISQEENQNFLNDPRLQSSRQSNITTSPLLVEHDEHDIEISESTIPKWKPISVKSTETKGFRDFSLPRQDETRSDAQHLEDMGLKRSRRSSTNIEVDARDCHSDSEQGWGGRWNPYETAEDGEICDEVSRKARRKKIPKQYATDDEEYYEGGRTNDEVDSEIERYIDEKVKNGSARGLDSDHSETSEDEIDANKDRKRKRSEKQKDKRDIKKKKKSRRRSSSDSDQSPYRGSNQGYRNMPTTIDIKVKLHNRRKVTVKRNDWIKPKQQMARHVMTKPTDLASTRLSLADIEQLNQMNSQAFMEENQSHKKSQPFADRRAKQYSVPRYDTITERIRDIRHSTSIKSPPQKSRRVSSSTTSKENDLRSTITRISEKRTAQKKRGGFL